MHPPENLDPPEPSEFQDRIQRILNDKKRKELEEKFGASFHKGDAELPADVEADWLEQLETFEEQMENAERVPIRQYIGNPTLRPPAAVPADEIASELAQALDLLAAHGIAIDVLAEVEDAELYRFIVEELLDEETDDVRLEGWVSHFIYEEFHPNDEYDVKFWAEDFLSSLFMRFDESIFFDEETLRDSSGKRVTVEEMKRRMAAFHARYPVIEKCIINPLTWDIEGDTATVEAGTSWWGKDHKGEDIQMVGRALIHLRRSKYGGWDVTQARVPGWFEN